MATYINDKSRLFKNAGEPTGLPTKKRSESRLKEYHSATDTRAWSNEEADQRDYMIDLTNTENPKGLQLGKYVPIDVLIDTLMANKNADIKQLKDKLDALEKLLDKLDLTPEQRKKVKDLKDTMAAGDSRRPDLPAKTPPPVLAPATKGDGAPVPAEPTAPPQKVAEVPTAGDAIKSTPEAIPIATPVAKSLDETPASPIAIADQVKPPAEIADQVKPPAADTPLPGKRKSSASGPQPGKIEVDSIGSPVEPAAASTPQPEKRKSSAGSIPQPVKRKSSGGSTPQSEKRKSSVGSTPQSEKRKSSAGSTSQPGKRESSAGSAAASIPQPDGTELDTSRSSCCVLPEQPEPGDSTPSATGVSEEPITEEVAPVDESAKVDAGSAGTGAPSGVSESKDEEPETMESLKKKLNNKENEAKQQRELARKAIEQLEALKDIMAENDKLKEKLRDSQNELSKLKMDYNKTKTCEEEILSMEKEIEAIKASASPNELDVIKKELTLMKKYCDKLKNIQDENKRLKSENMRLKNEPSSTSIPSKERESASLKRLKQQNSEIVSIDSKLEGKKPKSSLSEIDEFDESDMSPYYKEQAGLLRDKIKKLKDVTLERDKLKASVTKLENALKNRDKINEDIEVFKRRSSMLDSVVEERDSLHRRLSRLKGIEDELQALKNKAARVDELERALAARGSHTSRGRIDISDEELEALKYRAQEAEMLRLERDRLNLKLEELGPMSKDIKQLEEKANALEKVENERDNLKEKLEQLTKDYEDLRQQIDETKSMSDERDAYARRTRDLECIIADQEAEINKLVSHIERLSQGQEKQQDRMKQVVGDLRNEIDRKENLITQSEEQLATVQDQLLNTITDVASETTNLKQKIADLEQELVDTKNQLKDTQEELANLREENNEQLAKLQSENNSLQQLVERMKDITDNDKLIEILQKSKNAVKAVAQELGKKYSTADPTSEIIKLGNRVKELEEELENLRNDGAQERVMAENKALRKHSSEIQDVAKDQIKDLLNELTKAQDRISELETQLKMAQGDFDEATKENDDLKNKMKELQDTVGDANESLTTDNKKLSDEVEDLRKKLNDAKNEVEDHRKQLNDAKNEVEDLKKDNKSGDVESLVTDNKKLSDELEDLRKQLNDAKNEVEDLKKDNTSGDADESSSRDNKKLSDEIEDLRKQLNDAKNEVEDLRKKGLGDSPKKIQGCPPKNITEKPKETIPEKTDGTEPDLSKENELKELREQLEALKRENERLNKKLQEAGMKDEPHVDSSTDKDNEELQREIDRLNKKLESGAPDSLTDELKALREQLADLKKENDRLNKKILEGAPDDLAKDNQDLRAQIEKLKNELKTAPQTKTTESPNKEIDDLKNEIDRLNKKLQQGAPDSLVNENNDLRNQIEKLKSEQRAGDSKASPDIEKATLALKTCSDEKDKLQKEIDMLKKKLQEGAPGSSPDDCKAQLEKLKKENEDLKKQNMDFKNDVDRLNKTLKAGAPDALVNENNGLRDEIERLRKLQSAAPGAAPAATPGKQGINEEGFDNLKKTNDDLQKKIDALNKKLLEGASDAAVKENNDLRADNDALRKQLEDCKKSASSPGPKDGDMDANEKQGLLDLIKKLENQLNEIGEGEEKQDVSKDDILKMKDAEISQLKKRIEELEQQLKSAGIKPAAVSKEYVDKLKGLENELEKQKRESLDAIKGLKSQYDRDVKNLHNKYNDGIQKLQASHEELFSMGNQDLEREIKELKRQSHQSQQTIDALQNKLCCKKRPSLSRSVQNLDIEPVIMDDDERDNFRRLLKKILKDGIESLSFDELQFIHTKVCDATAKHIDKNRKRSDFNDGFNGEPDFKQRQKIAQSQVAKLNLEIALERERLEDLKRTLDVEKQTNSKLAERVNKQTMAVSSFMNALEQEQSRNKVLQENLQREREKTKQLMYTNKHGRSACECQRKAQTVVKCTRKVIPDRDTSMDRSLTRHGSHRR